MSEDQGNKQKSEAELKTEAQVEAAMRWLGAHKLVTVLITVVALLLIVGGAKAAVGWVQETSADNDRIAAEYQKKQEQKEERKAAKKAAETPAQKVGKTVRKALADDSGRKGVERVQKVDYNDLTEVINIEFAVKENLTNKLTKASARLDIRNVLEAVQKSQKSGVKVRFMNVEGTYPLADNLGHSKEERVVRASYRGDVVSKINFDNFLHKNVYKIADDVDFHPAFQD